MFLSFVISFQIKESASQTRDVLKQHFNDLKGTLGKLLDERLVTLLQEVDTIEQETIKPLDDCQKLIEHGVNTAEDLVQEGGSLLLNVANSDRHCSFLRMPAGLLPSVGCLRCSYHGTVYNIG